MSYTNDDSGELHIFFGAAPGVGKTWAMVDAGQQKHVEGRDVVIGHVRTHDRPEFGVLLQGLEVLPPHQIEVQGVRFDELNLDAVLRRRPDIVLVDDLAYTNLPGARHPKRYQDVIELLQAGISVYTTLSVQHVSSVADVVARITGMQVHEQVPDFVLEMATSIRLIDLAPDELLNRLSKRLRQGTVASSEAHTLLEPGQITTLRELALHIAASRIGDDVELSEPPRFAVEPWLTSSKVLVGISASPANERLLRATHRLVREMHTTWLAVHVETPADSRLGQRAQERIQHHLQLAKELGAETFTVAGQDVPRRLLEIAREYGATRLVVGRSKKRGPFSRAKSLAEELIDLSETIDVIVLAG